MAAGRLFRLKMRAGRSMMTFSTEPSEPTAAASGDEVVVSEHVAAFLVRQRAAEIVEVIEAAGEPPQTDEARPLK